MRLVIMRVALSIIGIILFALVLSLEIDGVLGFLMASLGLGLIIIGLSLKGIVKLFMNIS